MALGKRSKKAREGIDRDAFYNVDKAVDMIKKGATAKFDETIEVALNLGVDPKQGDQNVRGIVQLPHGTGKTLRIAVFAKGDKAKLAKDAVPTSKENLSSLILSPSVSNKFRR